MRKTTLLLLILGTCLALAGCANINLSQSTTQSPSVSQTPLELTRLANPVEIPEYQSLDSDLLYKAEFSDETSLPVITYSKAGVVTQYDFSDDLIPRGQSIDAGSIYVSFCDEQTGYVLWCSTPAAGQMVKLLFQTKDANNTYRFVADLSTLSGYPTGIAFSDPKHGVITTTYHGEDQYFFSTENAGRTWKSTPLLLDSGENAYVNAFPPIFYGSNNKSGVVILERHQNELSDYYLYQYEDGNWSCMGLLDIDYLDSYYIFYDTTLLLVDANATQYYLHLKDVDGTEAEIFGLETPGPKTSSQEELSPTDYMAIIDNLPDYPDANAYGTTETYHKDYYTKDGKSYGYCEIDKYYFDQNLPNAAVVNQTLAQYYEDIEAQYDEIGATYGSLAKEERDAYMDAHPSYQALIFNFLTYVGEDYVSLRFNDTFYSAGAAHPYSNYDGITIDIKTGEIMPCTNFFEESSEKEIYRCVATGMGITDNTVTESDVDYCLRGDYVCFFYRTPLTPWEDIYFYKGQSLTLTSQEELIHVGSHIYKIPVFSIDPEIDQHYRDFIIDLEMTGNLPEWGNCYFATPEEFPALKSRAYSNDVSVFDFDGDGMNELLIGIGGTCNADYAQYFYHYSKEDHQFHLQFHEYYMLSFYDTGIICAGYSHSYFTFYDNFWPYGVYEYDPTTNKYKPVASVDQFSLAGVDQEKFSYEYDYLKDMFPFEDDKDGDLLVYLVSITDDSGQTVSYHWDKDEYEKWRVDLIGDHQIDYHRYYLE